MTILILGIILTILGFYMGFLAFRAGSDNGKQWGRFSIAILSLAIGLPLALIELTGHYDTKAVDEFKREYTLAQLAIESIESREIKTDEDRYVRAVVINEADYLNYRIECQKRGLERKWLDSFGHSEEIANMEPLKFSFQK